MTEIPFKQYFHFKNRSVKNICELLFVLEHFSDSVFEEHVNAHKNDFADWVEHVLHEKNLSAELRNKDTRKKTINLLVKYLKDNDVYETIIIGAGIAGITAAIYAARKRMKFLVISNDFAGQLNVAGDIENYPGFKHTNFVEMINNLKEQARINNIPLSLGEELKSVEKQNNGTFKLTTNKADYFTETIILATGAKPRELNVPGEKELSSRGLTYCAVCDGPFFKDKTVAVIGGGNAALEAVEFVLRVAKKIYLLNINDQLTGHEVLIEKMIHQKNVEIINNAKTLKILGKQFVSGLEYEQFKKKKLLKVDGIFVEIGRVPNKFIFESLKNIIDFDESGHIKTNKFMATSNTGIFAAGDCTNNKAKQLIIAAGEGCMALLNATKFLSNKHHHAR
ncbi:MAG: FAD-dependent oxidoreductase [Nanoarchaeota archaeon]|nr:FAD-dependent oxidoreductase [Nanoarchaeota archaeon]MBU1029706.1 FAD-dependent oxidoreductase [Nanoarchaeota archaeon]MBU1850111.1 FAD-dependent oxidoreductase [Nanoarchaeota archaeon]